MWRSTLGMVVMVAALSFAKAGRADDGATAPEPAPQPNPVAPPAESSPPELSPSESSPPQSSPVAPPVPVAPPPSPPPPAVDDASRSVRLSLRAAGPPSGAARFFEAGPSLFHELGRAGGGPEIGGQRTSIGAGIGVGTWWGGKSERVPSRPAERTTAARFGDAGTLVLGGGIGGSYVSYSGTRSYTAGLSVGPGIDYFIAERFSVGLGVAYNRTRHRALQSTGLEIEQSSHSIGFTPRVGIDVPIASWLSLYPQAALSFGSGSISLESAGSRVEYSQSSLTVSAFAPILVHAASHAFIGFGPYASRDAERKVDIRVSRGGFVTNEGKVDNPSSSLGASLVVGGWL